MKRGISIYDPMAAVLPSLRLASEAVQKLKQNDLDSAAWRLADALGLLSDLLKRPEAALGVGIPTGRGFRIAKTKARMR